MLTEKLSPGEEARLRCYLDFKSEGPIRSIETGYDFAVDAPLPVPQEAVSKLLQHIADLEFVANLGDFSDIADAAARQEAITQRNKEYAYHAAEFTPPLYNIWRQQEKSEASVHFGNTEPRWLDNLLYLYTDPFDIVVDPSIRRRCLHCVGGESVKEVRDCTAAPNICRLWPYRMGHGRDRTRDAKPPSRLKAIRQECLFCMGGSAQFVRECESIHCFLWPYRMGKKPDHMVTDAKRESGRRLAASARLGVGAK